jgi:hypothetical protein
MVMRTSRPGFQRPSLALSLGALVFFNTLGPLFHCGSRTDLSIAELIAAANADADADADASNEPPVTCTPGTFTLVRSAPIVLFVIDRSQSMLSPFRQNQSRWDVLVSALSATLPGIDESSQSSMQLGALLFPGSGGSGASCAVAKAPDLAPARGNVDALLSLVRTVRPSGSTPTANALGAAGDALLGLRAASSARAMVLATDGAPSCNANLNGATCTCTNGSCRFNPERCLDDERTVRTIASYQARGITTYVIGIQDTANTEFTAALDAMADAGGRPLVGTGAGGHRYYAATSESELTSALTAIGSQVAACSYLTSSVPNAGGTIRVERDAQEIPYDETRTDGWSWSNRNNGELALAGEACITATSEAGTLVAQVTCDGDL